MCALKINLARCRSERANPNARNFGLGSRDMTVAARNALREKECNQVTGMATTALQSRRFGYFSAWLKGTHQIRDMRKIEKFHLVEYAEHLRSRVEDSDDRLSSYTTAANHLSAINGVMEQARGDKAIRYTARQAGYPKRDDILRMSGSISLSKHLEVKQQVSPRLSVQLSLMREFGLRWEGSCKLNIREELKRALKEGVIRVECEKNKTPRTVSIRNQQQIDALRQAFPFQSNHHSMIPPELTYAQYSSACYRELDQIENYLAHGERRTFSAIFYTEAIERLTGIKGVLCPVEAGKVHGKEHLRYIADVLRLSAKQAKELDRKVRGLLSKELGHSRVSVTNSYIG